MGRGGSQMVNGLAVYSDDLSSEPAEVKKILLIRKKTKRGRG